MLLLVTCLCLTHPPFDQPLPADIIVHGEWSFATKLVTATCNQAAAGPCRHPMHVVDASGCLCTWLQTNQMLRCNVTLLLARNENFGVLDPAPQIHYNGTYTGCTTWGQDAKRFKRLLDQPTVRRVLYRQTPPIQHHKLELVPLGPSRQFAEAWRKNTNLPAPARSTLYYVNHSPWRHRSKVFATTSQNFVNLTNEFCAKAFGCKAQRMSDAAFLQRLRSARFVESPPGMGGDCYRHYEVALAGAIPVVVKSLSLPVLHNITHLAVSRWEDVTPERLRHFWRQPTVGTPVQLLKSYWRRRIAQ